MRFCGTPLVTLVGVVAFGTLACSGDGGGADDGAASASTHGGGDAGMSRAGEPHGGRGGYGGGGGYDGGGSNVGGDGGGGSPLAGANQGGSHAGSASGGTANVGGAGGGGIGRGDCTNAFTSPLIDLEAVSVLTPIGLVGGGGTEIVGRSYVFPHSDIEGEIPLHAPTAMTLIGGTRYLPPGAPDGYQPDWALAFRPDCSSAILLELYHVKHVVPTLVEVLGDEAKPSSAWTALPLESQVRFDAGDVIGGYELGLNSVAFDFIVRDEDVTNAFAVPARYASSNILHVVCPYAYYAPELRAQLEQLLGAPGSGPIPGTACGSVAIDVQGSIAGQWFLNPDPATGRGNIILTNGYGNPHPIGQNPDGSITFGNMGPSQQGFRVYEEAATWRDPSEVTDEHCYQLGNPGTPAGYLYYSLVSDNELKVFYSENGECPESTPSAGGQTYYR